MEGFLNDDAFVPLPGFLGASKVFLKLEWFHTSGSIKIKPAMAMLESCERSGRLKPGGQVIESSSGYLGVALATLCRRKGYDFTCVLDSHASPANVRHIKSLGAKVIVCEQPDANGGFLGARIEIIRRFLAQNPEAVWTNQYDNDANPEAHYRWTAPAVLRNRPDVRSLFVGCGTTGTAIGCTRFMHDHAPQVKVVPVDTVGSVTFGFPPGPRFVPGMGTSRRPELIERNTVPPPILVQERDAVRMCRFVAWTYGLLIGGSSGSVLAGLKAYAKTRDPGEEVVVIAADSGERYLETVYDDAWVKAHFPGLLPLSSTRVLERATR
jgi:2,3-diaminopropionate biosynthesis protein SbnA